MFYGSHLRLCPFGGNDARRDFCSIYKHIYSAMLLKLTHLVKIYTVAVCVISNRVCELVHRYYIL